MEYKTNILSTRPLPPTVLEEAEQSGIDVDIISFIDTQPVTDSESAQRLDSLFSKEITAVFTSMNAVEAVHDHVKDNKPNWKIFCIGEATQDLVHRYFGGELLAGTAQSASELADVMIDAGVKEAVFFCGDLRRAELPEKLTANSVALEEIIVYRTITTPKRVEKKYNGILFFSPSAVESFFSVNTISSYTVLFAIGNTTGSAIRNFTGNAIITSDMPGKEELALHAISYFKTIRNPQ
jgi:uroporphyrinogen-III synthase